MPPSPEVEAFLRHRFVSNSPWGLRTKAGILLDTPDRTDELAGRYIKARKQHFSVLMGQYWALVAFKVVITMALLVLGGMLVVREQMNIGQFVASEIVIILVLNAVEKVILGLESIYDVLTALEKISNVTDLPLESQEGLTIPLVIEDGGPMTVELRQLTFFSHWSGNPVLQGIDLNVAAGEKICISGPNGSGKSTLLHMVAGMLDPDSGTILIDGHGLRSLSLENMRSAMGDSFTDEEIFSGTVLDNIMLGRAWIGLEQAKETADRTGLTAMLSDLPDGLLTVLDPLGSRLPKSLVRRIILARCLASRPRLVLYEDDVLPMDPEEHKELLDLLTGPEAEFTLIAVSNDPRFQRHFQRNIQLENGRIINR